MTDHAARVDRLKDALERPSSKYPLRRHRDDNYWDEVVVSADHVVLRGTTVPRYKTSGLSGDEWRISAKLVVTVSDQPVVERGFRDLNTLMTHAPGFIWACPAMHGWLDTVADLVTIVVKRKGVTLCTLDDAVAMDDRGYARSFHTFGDAVMGLSWHVVVANEQSTDWHHLSDAEERARCQQVGCAEPPVNVYRLKKLMDGSGRRCFFEPEYDFVGQYTWYCARHSRRGDCGFEDADANLELVDGSGVAREHEGDESPSAFGGVVEVKLPERG
jgi:hypothetical protein